MFLNSSTTLPELVEVCGNKERLPNHSWLTQPKCWQAGSQLTYHSPLHWQPWRCHLLPIILRCCFCFLVLWCPAWERSDVSSTGGITRMQEVLSWLVMQPWDECMIFRREPCLILQGHMVVFHFNVKHMAVVWNWGQRFKPETQNSDGGCDLWWQIKNFSSPFKSFIVCCFQVALSLIPRDELISGDLNTFD